MEYAFGPPELRKQEKKDATPLAGAAAEPARESKLPAAAGNSPAANDNGAVQELEERPTKRRKAERVATLTRSVAGTAPAESCDVQLAVEMLGQDLMICISCQHYLLSVVLSLLLCHRICPLGILLL